MSSGGGGGTTVQKQELDPFVRETTRENINRADEIASRPYEAYSGPGVVGFNQAQQAAQQGLIGVANSGLGNPQQAMQTASGIAGGQGLIQSDYNGANVGSGYKGSSVRSEYQPGYVGAGYKGANVQNGYDGADVQNGYGGASVQGGYGGQNIDRYQNPHTEQVVDAALGDIDRSRQMAVNQGQDASIAAGAFDGSRSALAEGATNEGYARQAAQTAAGLRQSGFNTALQASQQDVNRDFQAQQYNDQSQQYANQADMQAQQYNDQAAQNANRADMQASQYNDQAAQNAAQMRLQAGQYNDQSRQYANNANIQTQQYNDQARQSAAQMRLQAGQYNDQSRQYANQAQMQAQGQNLQAQMQAAGLLGNLGQQQYQNAINNQNLVAGVGDAQQGMSQQQADYQRQEWERAQGYDERMLNLRGQALNGSPLINAGSTSSQGGGRSAAAGALGGAASGAAFGSMIPGLGTGIGAGVGAGAGLLGLI